MTRETYRRFPWRGSIVYLVFCFASSAAGMVFGLFVHDWIAR
jgi:hypothetical protein